MEVDGDLAGHPSLGYCAYRSGSSSGVERKLPKLDVAGSTPVSRSSIKGISADVAQLVEHILGKDEVTSSNLVIGSSIFGVSQT